MALPLRGWFGGRATHVALYIPLTKHTPEGWQAWTFEVLFVKEKESSTYVALLT